ncbi:MAG TPA: hypothetical protein VF148_15145 [Acidimicrobiia bacterium]
MRIRTISLIALLALVVAACGGEAESATTSPQETTTPAPEAVVLSYALEAGTTYQYQVDIDQAIDLTSTGDTTATGGDKEIPGEASISIQGTSDFTYTVSDGPEPGTFEIEIVGDFSDLEFNGTVDGESVDSSEIPEIAEMEPVDVTIVVDERGNVIPDDSSGPGEDFLGGLGGLDMLDQLGAAAGTGQFVGPPLSEDEVTVGDTWSETIEVPTMPGADPVTTRIESEVVGTDTIDGSEVFVIETTSTTGAVEFDLAEFLIGFMSSFMAEDATDEEQAELDAIIDELRFVFSIDETVSDMTSWFDLEAGLSRQSELASDTHMVMDVNIPDETTGEMVEFAMDMNLSQEITYRLTGSGGV